MYETTDLFGMHIACTTLRDAVGRLLNWCAEPRGGACRYVVTPNVDHVVMFQRRPELRLEGIPRVGAEAVMHVPPMRLEVRIHAGEGAFHPDAPDPIIAGP